MTTFEKDIFKIIADGHATDEQIIQKLLSSGRRKIDLSRLSRAMGRLRTSQKIITSMAGYSRVVEQQVALAK